MPKLEGKIALVTGAAKGMGRAIAELFAQQGASVAVAARKIEQAESVSASLPGDALAVALDVTRPDEWAAAIAAVNTRWGALDILVNCAGISGAASTEAVSEADWHKHFAVNLDGPFYGCRAALPLMRKRGTSGSIVNVSSVFGIRITPGFAAYSVSKAALNALTRVLALECAAASPTIRVNAVIPGGTETDMFEEALKNSGLPRDQAYAMFSKIHPMGRIGKPEEVAQAVLWLASDLSSFTTGVELRVDGGSAIQA